MSDADVGHRRWSANAVRGLARFAGRASMASVFVMFGCESAAKPTPSVELAADAGVPAPELAVRLNDALIVVGGLATAAGLRPRLAAAMLVGTIAPTTIVAHAVWRLQDREARQAQRVQFYKNVAIFRGAMLAKLAPQPE